MKGENMVCCEDKVTVIKALADETRLEILNMLSEGEKCACKILEKFNITQPTLSYHMKILTESGIITARRDGAWMHYSLNEECLIGLTGFLNSLLNARVQKNKEECCQNGK